MRILILGAGAVGGYYGARLMEAGADVTFLVRERRAGQLARDGLVVTGAGYDVKLAAHTVLPSALKPEFDLALLSCKAYDLDQAIDSIRPGLGEATLVLPLLNGIAHLETLDRVLGRARVVGGSCHLAASLDDQGTIRQWSPLHRIVYGVREGNAPHAQDRLRALHQVFLKTPVPAVLSTNIIQDLWDKYVLLCTAAGMTCLMRGAVGDIMAAERGEALTLEFLGCCTKVAADAGYPLAAGEFEGVRTWLTKRGSAFTASMLRDVEHGGRIESEHVVGDMLKRAQAAGIPAALLAAAHCHLQTYEARRQREHA